MEWLKEDTRFLRKFLESDTGQKLIDEVKRKAPSLEGQTIEEQAMNASRFDQYRKDIQLIKRLAATTDDREEPSPYLDLSPLDVREKDS